MQHPRHSQPFRVRGRRLFRTILVLLVATAVSLLPNAPLVGSPTSAAALESPSPASAHSAPEILRERADLQIPRFPPDDVLTEWLGKPAFHSGTGNDKVGGLPIIDEASNRSYQLYAIGTGFTDKQVGLLVRDLDTLEIVAGFVLPNTFQDLLRFPNGRGTPPHALDADRDRLYLWLEKTDTNDLTRAVLVVDETKLPDGAKKAAPEGAFTQVSLGLNPNDLSGDPRLARGGPANGFQGITYTHGKVYVVLGIIDDASPAWPTQLFQFDPDTWEIEWDRDVRGCRSVYSSAAAGGRVEGFVPVLRTEEAIYIPCTSNRTATVVRLPFVQGPDSIAPNEDASDIFGPEQTFRGDGVPVGYGIDASGRRIHFRVQTSQNASLLTFDVAHLAYVGQQAVDELKDSNTYSMSWGVDQVTGRVYVQVPGSLDSEGDPVNSFGLSLLDARNNPVLPGLRFPVYFTASSAENVKTLPRDSKNGRLVLYDGPTATDQTIRVLEDAPPIAPPPTPDPDLNTVDVEEEAGRTDIGFSSDASGYGLRHLLVGGVTGLLPSDVINRVHQNALNLSRSFRNAECHDADREFLLGRVNSVRLSNSLRSALSTAVDADPGTRQDIEVPARCVQRPKFGQTAEGDDSFVESQVKEVEDTLFEDLPSAAANAANDLDDLAPWLPGFVKQHLGDVLGDTLSDDEDEIIRCDEPAEGHEEGDCIDLRDPASDAANDGAGRNWPFVFSSCTPAQQQVTNSPSFDEQAFTDDLAEDPTAPTSQDPAALTLTGFESGVDCSQAGTARAHAVAQPQAPERPLPVAAPEAAAPATSLPSNVTVASASSSVTNRLDPERGMVTRVESLTRGIQITVPGAAVIEIAGVYAVAETVARGRPDTASTSYERVIWGAEILDPDGTSRTSCNFCADEARIQEFVNGLNQALGDRGQARAPKPDARLLTGTPGGYQAAIQLDEFQNISNIIVNGDGLLDVAALEIALFNDSGPFGRQRQIFQFAGTRANSQYGIFCLGGGKPENGKCVLPPIEGGGVTVSLTDGDTGDALAGAEFSVSGPERGSCTTAADGRCTVSDLEPGSYTVEQESAPPGYLEAPNLTVTVSPGSISSARFVNLRNEGRIEITLADAESGSPLAGGVFQVSDDANGDGVAGPTDPVFAACTTDQGGVCLLEHVETGMRSDAVPLGAYVVSQLEAPDGYEPVTDPVAFELALSGQVAELPYTNGTGAGGAAVLSGGVTTPQGIQSVATSTDPSTLGGFFEDLFDSFRNFLRRSPAEALLFAASTALFVSPLWASWRRRMLLGAADLEDQ